MKMRRSCQSNGERSGRAINVLFVIDYLYDVVGGAEQHLMFLLEGLYRGMQSASLAVLSGTGPLNPARLPTPPIVLARRGVQCGANAKSNGQSWPARRAYDFGLQVSRLAALINSLRIDVVHAFCPRSELAAMVATRLAGRGRVLGVRRNVGYWHTDWTIWRSRFSSLLGAEYVANCEAARDFATRAEWIPRRRIAVIPNPFPHRRLADAARHPVTRAGLRIAADEKVVAIVATLRPVKDHGTFLRAARLVLDQHPRTRFIAVGSEDPQWAPQMRAMAEELHVERQVCFLGAHENPLAILRHVDVGVLSSRSEAFSNALVEYAAAGVPAVATDVGGTREIVLDGATGFVVPPESPETMANRVLRLLRDDGLRRALGARARTRAQELLDPDTILKRYAKLYLHVAGRNNATWNRS
jgi:L-malate glycosyltransferase